MTRASFEVSRTVEGVSAAVLRFEGFASTFFRRGVSTSEDRRSATVVVGLFFARDFFWRCLFPAKLRRAAFFFGDIVSSVGCDSVSAVTTASPGTSEARWDAKEPEEFSAPVAALRARRRAFLGLFRLNFP